MRRINLGSLTREELQQLAELIQQYATPAVVSRHWRAARRGAHRNPEMFLSFHREYLGGLEEFLTGRGYSQWDPLPAWNPADPIPPEFFIPNRGPGRLENLNPQINFFPDFSRSNLVRYEDSAELGAALMARHNRVHRAIGGVMNNQRRAPQAPVFWVYHAFIDDLWWEWERLKGVTSRISRI